MAYLLVSFEYVSRDSILWYYFMMVWFIIYVVLCVFS